MMTEERIKELLVEAVAQAAIQPELLKLKDVATMLSLSPPSVLRLVDAGEIPFVLYGRTRMYRRRDVMAYIENMETQREEYKWSRVKFAASSSRGQRS